MRIAILDDLGVVQNVIVVGDPSALQRLGVVSYHKLSDCDVAHIGLKIGEVPADADAEVAPE